MADSCPECIHIVPVSRARVCSGRTGRRERRGIRFCPPSQAGRTKPSSLRANIPQPKGILQTSGQQCRNHYYILVILFIMLPPPLPPALCSFHPTGFQSTPSCKRDKKKLPKKKKKLAHSGANHRGFNAKAVTFLHHITNGLFPEAPKATS